MSRPVNEAQMPSNSPSHAPHTSSSTPIDSQQTDSHHIESNTAEQLRSSAPPTSEVAIGNGISLNRNYPLHEFHSLLEAAQRIANSDPIDTEGHRWREDDQPEPIIHLNRRRTGGLTLGRSAPGGYLTRPHVPGEDSGSEGDGYEDSIDSIRNIEREQRRANELWRTSRSVFGATEDHTNMDTPYVPLDGAESNPSRYRPDQGRTRDRQQMDDEERDLIEQALARSRAARSRFEADNQRASLSNGYRTRYSTTGASPISQSFYDWAPEPISTAEPSPSIFRSRSRAASMRRWRPAERLQDYASNSARRDSGNTTIAPQGHVSHAGSHTTGPAQTPNHHPYPAFADPTYTGHGVRANDTNLDSHEDVVDRVERALQQYRIARRALRPLNADVAFEAIPSSSTPQSGFPETSNNRASSRSVDTPDSTDGLPQSGADVIDLMDYTGSAGRNESSGFSSRDYNHSSSTLRWAPSGLTRREDPIRQRIREQIRERRRRGAQQALESGPGRELPLARGPLFESAGTPQFAVTSDARQMLERARQATTRERSSEYKRARGALQYLARLRDPEVDEVKAWTLAAELGLHNRTLDETSDKNLPCSKGALPVPSFSSWLEPGTTWTGVQDANDTGGKPTGPSPASNETTSASSQTERLDNASRQNDSFRSRMRSGQDPLERTLLSDPATRDPIDLTTSSMQMLERAEMSLSSMLERSEELLRENDRQLQDNNEQLRQSRERLRDTDRRLILLDEAVRRRSEARARQITTEMGLTDSDTKPDTDWWNVKVTLHSVDEKSMTVSGTMTASHKLHRPSYNTASSANGETTGEEEGNASMDSFFTGHIIDFVRHGLDTAPSSESSKISDTAGNNRHRRQQDEWKVGGPEIDLNYWAGIGPFKRELDRVVEDREAEHQRLAQSDDERRNKRDGTSSTMNASSGEAGEDSDYLGPRLTSEEKETIRMDTMADLLCDTKWLNENIGAQGWILMRWKERCFVTPGTQPNPDVRRPWISGPAIAQDSSTPFTSLITPPDPSNPRLSIAEITTQSRLRRRRERDARVWSTNAAEREEIASTNGPFSFPSTLTRTDSGSQQQPSTAWGLTISGFYYVALERKTGRIEALYYDCGSTPFQKLKMNPQTLYRVPTAATTKSSRGAGAAGQSKSNDRNMLPAMGEKSVIVATTEDELAGDQRMPDFTGVAGLKTSFSLVEFR